MPNVFQLRYVVKHAERIPGQFGVKVSKNRHIQGQLGIRAGQVLFSGGP